MKEKKLYISPIEGYTGYTTFIMIGTSTSDIDSFMQTEEGEVKEFKEEVEKEYVIPESREGQFIDKELSEFYKKKGYKSKE